MAALPGDRRPMLLQVLAAVMAMTGLLHAASGFHGRAPLRGLAFDPIPEHTGFWGRVMQLISRRSFIAGLAAGVASGVATGVAPAAVAQTLPPPVLARVARVAVHPAIGVARVGNSRDHFFFGPEVPGALPRGPFKDDEGAIARQAARFRIFAYDRAGNVLGEVTARDAAISWEVRVANKKAAWYETDVAFDTEGAPGAGRRNADVKDRASLVIEAAPRVLAGAAAAPQPLDGGRFHGTPITLGEVMTDGEGRLVLLPGSGQAYAAPDAPPLDSFADNSGWADDSCDGPPETIARMSAIETAAGHA